MNFLFNVGQKLSCVKLLKEQRADWTKGIHCVVENQMMDLVTKEYYYLVLEYYYTDFNNQGELRLVTKDKLEKEYIPYVAPTV